MPRARRERKLPLILDCEGCGEPVTLSPARYDELVLAGQRPLCRKNGCERFYGAKSAGTSRSAQVPVVVELPDSTVVWKKKKRGHRNGPLAKMVVKSDLI